MAEIPEHILRRSAEARAKAEGRSVEEILAELKGESPTASASSATTEAAPEPATATQPAAETEAAATATATTVAVADPPNGEVRDLSAESEQYGVPPPLLRRAALARARWDGLPAPQFAGEGAAPAAPPPAAAAAASG
nr:hypothetical protein [Acidimicrobiia bacterium]